MHQVQILSYEHIYLSPSFSCGIGFVCARFFVCQRSLDRFIAAKYLRETSVGTVMMKLLRLASLNSTFFIITATMAIFCPAHFGQQLDSVAGSCIEYHRKLSVKDTHLTFEPSFANYTNGIQQKSCKVAAFACARCARRFQHLNEWIASNETISPEQLLY